MLATIGLLAADLVLWIKLLLGAMLAMFARWHWNRYAAPLSPFFVRRLTFHTDAQCLVEYGDGREWSGQLCGALMTNMLVIVHSRNGWKRRSTVIVPDALSEDHFRRLRVYLNTRVWEESEEDS